MHTLLVVLMQGICITMQQTVQLQVKQNYIFSLYFDTFGSQIVI